MKKLDFDYRFGFSMPEKHVYKAKKGLDREVVEKISLIKKAKNLCGLKI